VKSDVDSNKELFKLQLLRCDNTTEAFKGVNCPHIESSRRIIQNFNITLLLKNKEFQTTAYNTDYVSYGSAKSGFPMILPNGKFQWDAAFFRGIYWPFSVPVFETTFKEI
jgi:hypothetical protein